jgi:hypothetical protein
MAGFHKKTSVWFVLAGLMATLVSIPIHPGPCSAETGVPASDGDTFVLPGSGASWTRDGNPAGKELTWAAAHDFLNDLSRKRFRGCAGWRLPSRGELTALAAYLNSGYADDEGISAEPDYYWSVSVDPLEKDYADAVNLEDGSVDSCDKSEFNYVWPVCGQ